MTARFPIGRFTPPVSLSPEERSAMIHQLEKMPQALRKAIDGLNDEQLDTPYREGGWTVRQVVHHLADSHMNSYIRFKLAATEDEPVVTAYDEAVWAELPDARDGDIGSSLWLLDGLHDRWTAFLRNLSDGDYRRTFRHPEKGTAGLDRTLAYYAWHARHHVGHILQLREKMEW